MRISKNLPLAFSFRRRIKDEAIKANFLEVLTCLCQCINMLILEIM